MTCTKQSMNILNEANRLTKMAILVTSLAVSAAIAPAASAQLNPHPSIFDEPTYNRAFAPRPKPRHRNRAEPLRGRHGHAPRPKPPMSPRSINGAPPPPVPRFEGKRPAPPAGDRRRLHAPRPGQAPRPRLNEPRAPRPIKNRVPSAPPDRVYDAPNPPGNGTTPPPFRSPDAPVIVPPPGSP